MGKSNMAFYSCLITFLLSHRLQFHFALGENNSQPNCTESFRCGTLGVMNFPFYKSTEPANCGLSIVDCDAKPHPKVKLMPERNWYNTTGKRDGNIIRVQISWLQQRNCNRFNTLSLPSTAVISFTMFPNITLFKCDSADQGLDRVFAGYEKFTGCVEQGFNVYYNYTDDRGDASALVTSPANCSMFTLPRAASDDANLDPKDLHDIVAGEVNLEWHLSDDCYDCHHRGGQCQLDNEIRFHCSKDLVAISRTREALGDHLRLVLGLVGFASGVAMLTIFVFCLRKKYSIFNFKKDKYQNVEIFLKNCGSLAPKRYHYHDVKKMTSSFKISLGQGGYGSVYKGKLCDGRLVAVKILNDIKENGEEFINEVASISRTSHVNIVKLLGFCFEHNKRALIYEFMHNGSLEKFIYDQKSLLHRKLGWQTLYKIAVGIARGLEYLHRGCNTQILHFDIKPHNILLNEEFCPKISDFGLSKLCTRIVSSVSILGPRGTIGYIAPEVVCRSFGMVSHKSDVYSYGVMILEMVGGRKNVDVGDDNHTSELYYPHWIYKQLELNEELEFDGISNEDDNEKARKMIMASLWCIQTNPSTRPSMTKVVEMLEGNLESLQIPPKPYLYSPPRSSDERSSV